MTIATIDPRAFAQLGKDGKKLDLVGAGLLFSGITDTCGMGLILARMPWNHCSPDSTSQCAR